MPVFLNNHSKITAWVPSVICRIIILSSFLVCLGQKKTHTACGRLKYIVTGVQGFPELYEKGATSCPVNSFFFIISKKPRAFCRRETPSGAHSTAGEMKSSAPLPSLQYQNILKSKPQGYFYFLELARDNFGDTDVNTLWDTFTTVSNHSISNDILINKM